MEILLGIGVVVALFAGITWISVRFKREGVVDEQARQQRKRLDEAEDANRVRRDITRRGAAERLRSSKWNVDNVPDDDPYSDQ